jgi:hypothetical protein
MIPNFPLAGFIAALSAVPGLLLVGVDIFFRDPSSRFLLSVSSFSSALANRSRQKERKQALTVVPRI